MSKKSQNMNAEIGEIIQKNTTYYTFNFITLVFAFLFFNISFMTLYNLHTHNNVLKRNYSLNIYINNNVSLNSIENIERKIIGLNKVETINYQSKEIALKQLSEKLGLSSTNLDNPLLNSFEITTNSEENLKEITKSLDEVDGIKEAVINQDKVHYLNKEIAKNSKIISFLFFMLLIPSLIMIFCINHAFIVNQHNDIESKTYLGLDKKLALKPYYFVNNVKFISAGIIGGLIFLNFYQIARRDIESLNNILTLFQVGIITAILLALISLVFLFISSLMIKNKR